jgi:hypothetical protein
MSKCRRMTRTKRLKATKRTTDAYPHMFKLLVVALNCCGPHSGSVRFHVDEKSTSINMTFLSQIGPLW